MLALHICGDAFTDEEKARDFAYYEALTVRDSSLSACTQAVIAAEVGHLELAYDYFGETALMDLHDLEHNTRDGLHIASPRRAPGSPPSPGSAACATTAACSASRRGCPRGSSGSPSASGSAGAGSGSRRKTPATYGLLAGRRSRSATRRDDDDRARASPCREIPPAPARARRRPSRPAARPRSRGGSGLGRSGNDADSLAGR